MLPWELKYDWNETNHDYFKGQTFVSVDMNLDGTPKLNPDGTLNVKHDNTILIDRDTQLDFEFGEKVVNDTYNVYVKSSYPGFTTDQLEGVFIDPNTNEDIQSLIKKKHWFTGFSISLSVTPGYDVINNKAAVVVGPSLNYNIYSW